MVLAPLANLVIRHLKATINSSSLMVVEFFAHNFLPLGYMSEEPLVSNNKWLRFYREFFARNFSREENMYDMFMRCYYMSDPRIREIIMKRRKIKDSDDFMELPDAVKGLLVTKS